MFLVTLALAAVELSLPLTVARDTRLGRVLRSNAASLSLQDSPWRISLHFAEVWAFYGSLGGALADMQDSARWRAGFEQGERVRGFDALNVVALHCFQEGRSTFMPITVSVFSGLLWGLVAPWSRSSSMGSRSCVGYRGLQALGLPWRCRFLIGLIGLVASCVWYVAMPAHAHVHEHLLYRHLILLLRAMGDILGGSRGRADRAMACWRMAKSRDRR